MNYEFSCNSKIELPYYTPPKSPIFKILWQNIVNIFSCIDYSMSLKIWSMTNICYI